MSEPQKTKSQLLAEVEELRRRLAEYEGEPTNAGEGTNRSLSESMLRSVLDNSSTVIFVKDLDGRYLLINRRYEELFHITNEEIIGKTDHDIFPQEAADAFREKDCRALEADAPIEEEEIVPHDDGSHTYISVKFPLYRGGEPYSTCGIATDITERKLVEEDLRQARRLLEQRVAERTADLYRSNAELRESESRYRAVSETIGAAMIMTDEETIITFANSEFEKLTGFDRTEVLGKMSWLSLFDDESLGRMKRYHQLRNEDPALAPRTYEAVLVDRRGDRHEGVITVTMVPGTTTRVASFMDMTKWNAAKRLAETREAQLRQADRLATLGTLVSGVAHEINNPNNYISLNAKILRKMWDDIGPILKDRYDAEGDFPLAGIPYSRAHGRVAHLLEGLTEGSSRIAAIVAALKDFSRKDRDDLNETVDMNHVVVSALLILANMTKKHTDRLVVQRVEGLPAVQGSAQQLEQVLINLLTNAYQALQSHEQAVHVTTSYDDEGNMVVVTVRDEGPGLAPELLEQVMKPFFTTKRETGGTGLGLSISSNIVRNHGGELTLSSEPDEGCCATMRLPVKD